MMAQTLTSWSTKVQFRFDVCSKLSPLNRAPLSNSLGPTKSSDGRKIMGPSSHRLLVSARVLGLVGLDGLDNLTAALQVFPEQDLVTGNKHFVFRSMEFITKFGERDL